MVHLNILSSWIEFLLGWESVRVIQTVLWLEFLSFPFFSFLPLKKNEISSHGRRQMGWVVCRDVLRFVNLERVIELCGRQCLSWRCCKRLVICGRHHTTHTYFLGWFGLVWFGLVWFAAQCRRFFFLPSGWWKKYDGSCGILLKS